MAGHEDRASDWIRFARTEGHDSFWLYRELFHDLLLETIREPVPPGGEPHRRARIPLFLLWRARKGEHAA